MRYKPEKGIHLIPTAAREQESPQNNPKANKQVLADFQELSGEELQAVTGGGGVDPKIVGGIVGGLVVTSGIVGGTTYALTHKGSGGGAGGIGGIGTGGGDDPSGG
jgi:hypothetical protein